MLKYFMSFISLVQAAARATKNPSYNSILNSYIQTLTHSFSRRWFCRSMTTWSGYMLLLPLAIVTPTTEKVTQSTKKALRFDVLNICVMKHCVCVCERESERVDIGKLQLSFKVKTCSLTCTYSHSSPLYARFELLDFPMRMF